MWYKIFFKSIFLIKNILKYFFNFFFIKIQFIIFHIKLSFINFLMKKNASVLSHISGMELFIKIWT